MGNRVSTGSGDVFFAPKWITRRVESIELIDINHCRRSVSLDIDLYQPGCQDARESSYLPLALIPFGLMLDFSIRGESSQETQTLTIIPSAQRAELKRDLLRKRVRAVTAGYWRGDLAVLEDAAVRLLNFDVATRTDVESDDIDNPLGIEELVSLDVMSELGILEGSRSIAAARDWAKLLTSTSLLDAVNKFRMNNLLAIERRALNAARPSRVKFDWIEYHHHLRTPQLYPSRRLPARWLGRAFPSAGYKFDLPIYDAPRIGHSHLRVIAPSGVFLGQASFLHDIDRPNSSCDYSYRTRETTSRSLLYLKQVEPVGDYYFACSLWPRMAGFLLPAMSIALLGVLAALVALGWQHASELCDSKPPALLCEHVPNQHFIETVRSFNTSVFAGLSLIVTLAVGLLVRDGEHDTRQFLLRAPRRNTLLLLAPILSAIGLTAIPITPDWLCKALWLTCGSLSLLVLWTSHGRYARRCLRSHKSVTLGGQKTRHFSYTAVDSLEGYPLFVAQLAVLAAVDEYVARGGGV